MSDIVPFWFFKGKTDSWYTVSPCQYGCVYKSRSYLSSAMFCVSLPETPNTLKHVSIKIIPVHIDKIANKKVFFILVFSFNKYLSFKIQYPNYQPFKIFFLKISWTFNLYVVSTIRIDFDRVLSFSICLHECNMQKKNCQWSRWTPAFLSERLAVAAGAIDNSFSAYYLLIKQMKSPL